VGQQTRRSSARRHPAPFDEPGLRALLDGVRAGRLSIEGALDALRALPFEDLGFARLDHHRALRKGFPEVVFCAGKTPAQLALIVARLARATPQLLGTRATLAQYRAARRRVRELRFHEQARAIFIDRNPDRARLDGVIVAAAGTSDLSVAEEAALTLELMGHSPLKLYDVGVAGLHRLLRHGAALRAANVIVAVAGMEGALPSVLAGLVSAPVVAVPTSVGYGTSLGGLAALLAMLNSCAPGLSVVNIDNGFGAGYLAAAINRKIHAAVDARGAAPPRRSS
jgi:NCAIR mutase (PurE)-related protein